ncbi:hydroxyethylthiazole kinase [Pseudolabrys sp. Root1462]|uniref:hydroxyethylthiazole kinase n=1 Tax=Pseudolabrys sp. Root1462 TaxID=1736466 RepID=UPI00070261CB|nr:hydroxyethylthiazole kinase [Pseudolabrys sp. Root1462]KQZ00183.1 hydroxyethylthiazole kinase [Pseudolabrys sp. Root1462]
MQEPTAPLRQDGQSRQIASAADLTVAADGVLGRLREKAPRVHCITNSVAQNFTANVLLALGAIPSMTLSPVEIGSFVKRSDALLVNLGTFGTERREATSIAVNAAVQGDLPWVLDPVFVDRAPPRASYARDLLFLHPTAMRLNAQEFAALAETETSEEAVAAFAREHRVTVGLSGAKDLIADGSRAVTLANGDPLMAKVTAMGCAASAMVGACLAVERDALIATSSALLIAGVAGEIAAETAQGPGSFAVGILDALHSIDGAALAARARITWNG